MKPRFPRRFGEPAAVEPEGYRLAFRATDRDSGQPVLLRTLAGTGGADLEADLRLLAEAEVFAGGDEILARRVVSGRTEDGRPFYAIEDPVGSHPGSLARAGDWAALADVAAQLVALISRLAVQQRWRPALSSSTVRVLRDGDQVQVVVSRVEPVGLPSGYAFTPERLVAGAVAPERLRGSPGDVRSDLYALGALLYAAIVGGSPLEGVTAAELLRFSLDGSFLPPSRMRPGIPAEMERLVLEMLARSPADRPPSLEQVSERLARLAGGRPRPVETVAPRLLSTAPVGREAQIELFGDLLQTARIGRGGAILLRGPEGSGKTVLLRELATRAAAAGARVRLASAAGLRRTPYRVTADLLRSLAFGASPERTRRLDRLREWLVGDGPAVDFAADAVPGPRFDETVTREVLSALREDGDEALDVVLMDDLERIDRSEARLLRHLLRSVEGERLIVVGAMRAEGETIVDGLAELARDGLTALELGPLGEREVAELASQCLGTRTLPSGLVDWLQREASGLPRRVLLLLRELVEDGVLAGRSGEWSLRPEGLPAMLAVDRLATERGRSRLTGEVATQLLEAAAAFGEGFTLGDLVDPPADATTGGQWLEALDALLESGLILPAILASHGRWVFASESARAEIYGALDDTRRRALHEELARRAEAGQSPSVVDSLGAVAFHLGRGGDPGRGAEFNVLAADRAGRLVANVIAADCYRTALDLLDLAGNEERRSQVRERLADLNRRDGREKAALSAYHFLLEAARRGAEARPKDRARLAIKVGRISLERQEWGVAETRFREAMDLVRTLPDLDRRQRAEAAVLLSRAVAAGGETETARQLLEEELAVVGDHPSAEMVLRRELGCQLLSLDDAARALPVLGRVVELAAGLQETDLEAAVRIDLAQARLLAGDPESACEALEKSLNLAEERADPVLLLKALDQLIDLRRAQGQWPATLDLLTRALGLRRVLGREAALGRLRLGEALEVCGRWNEAEAHYRQAEEAGDRDVALEARAALAGLARKRGRLEEALRAADTVLEEAIARGLDRLAARVARDLAQVDKDAEDWEGAREWVERAFERLERAPDSSLELSLRVVAADLEVRRGDPTRADEELEAALPLARDRGDLLGLGKLAVARARLASGRGRRDEADRTFREAVGFLRRAGARYELGRALYEWGVHVDREEQALELLDEAARTLDEIGAALEVQRARGAVSRIRARHQAATSGGVIGLYEVAKVLNSTLDLDEVLHRVLDLARERLKAQRGILVVLDPITSEPKVRAARSVRSAEDDEAGERVSQAIVDQVVRTGRSMLSADVRVDPRIRGIEGLKDSGVVSVLAVPVAIKERIGGAIYVDHGIDENLFDSRDLAFLEAFADQAAIAIENARLYGELDQARSRLSVENEGLREEILSERHLSQLVGGGETVERIQFAIRRAATSSATVLVRGESGSGKGLVARLIHAVGPRSAGPFIKFNCAALPETLIESELFGYEKGAFTGADRRKLGRFELARGGTIFLDEIGKISLGVQSKLLRVVEEKEFERVGGTETIRVDARIIAATNLDIARAIERGEFREDLFYRLNIIPIHLPPLRDRIEDIALLAEHFVRKICHDMGQDPKRLAPGVLALFRSYAWPGNVRELEAAIHRAIVMTPREELEPGDFFWMGIGERAEQAPPPGEILHPAYRQMEVQPEVYREITDRVDRSLIQRALSESDGKIREAARRLGLARNTLRAKMKKYGLAQSD